ncbi:MAG: hypothetical protein MJK12_07640 [Colwellia sp.]|nr:hypothetical protein [Colwellia sp.]
MQFYILKPFILLFIISSFSACISEEHSQEKALYKKAKKSRELSAQTQSLKILAKLEPQVYQQQFLQAEQASLFLQQAREFEKQQYWYQSYQLAHNSYRTLTSKEAKALLVISGKHFRDLVKIHSSLEKSYRLLPKNIFKQLSHYDQQPVAEWNIVEFNELLKQLTQSSIELSRVHSLMNNTNYPQDIILWLNYVQKQAHAVAQYRNYLVSKAINASAKALLSHNKALTKEAIELLAYVKPDIAMNGLQPKFNEAFLQYHPYQELMQNIYLSISSAGNKQAVEWYNEWQQTEKAVLMLEGEFSQYRETSKYRRYIITKISLENTTNWPNNKESLSSVQSFIGASATVQSFLDKLLQDKALLL